MKVTSAEATDGREQPQEKDHLRREDAQVKERIRQRIAWQMKRRQLADRLGTSDDDLLDALEHAGFTLDTVSLLAIVPLVETAWAEGRVQGFERRAILNLATRRGIDAYHPAYIKLKQVLTSRPSKEFFEQARRALTIWLRNLPTPERERQATEIVQACVRVAHASGSLGYMDLGRRVCTEERLVLDRLVSDFALRDITPTAT